MTTSPTIDIPSHDLIPPTVDRLYSFDRYSLLTKIASGGMAEIYAARLKGAAGFSKLVAIKRILPHVAHDQEFATMFLDEAQTTARISHPNVCQVFDLVEHGGTHYLVMEYLEGIPLSEVMARLISSQRGLDPILACGIIAQACEGLHSAHELRDEMGRPAGVVHRDVSPGNLFLTTDGTVKVLDFGIARARWVQRHTRTGMLLGKCEYMSPEQARGGESVDRRADVFALGICLHELLTGKRLFRRVNDYETLRAVLRHPVPRAVDVFPSVPAALDEVVMRALKRERDERFSTARELRDNIMYIMRAFGGPAEPAAIGNLVRTQFSAELQKRRGEINRALGRPLSQAALSPQTNMASDWLSLPKPGETRLPILAMGSPMPRKTAPSTVRIVPPVSALAVSQKTEENLSSIDHITQPFDKDPETTPDGLSSNGVPSVTAGLGVLARKPRSSSEFHPIPANSAGHPNGVAPNSMVPRPNATLPPLVNPPAPPKASSQNQNSEAMQMALQDTLDRKRFDPTMPVLPLPSQPMPQFKARVVGSNPQLRPVTLPVDQYGRTLPGQPAPKSNSKVSHVGTAMLIGSLLAGVAGAVGYAIFDQSGDPAKLSQIEVVSAKPTKTSQPTTPLQTAPAKALPQAKPVLPAAVAAKPEAPAPVASAATENKAPIATNLAAVPGKIRFNAKTESKLYIDGERKLLGTTPFELSLPPGEYKFKAVGSTGKKSYFRVQVKPDAVKKLNLKT